MNYDVTIIGGGHNGLVAACYLQKAGLRTLVLEAKPILGGACVTEEVFPGHKVSTTSYVCSLLRPVIISDLKLHSHGLEFIERNPSSFTPLPDGRHLFFWGDQKRTCSEIAKFSTKDAEAYPKYEALISKLASFVEPLLMSAPPDPESTGIRNLWDLFGIARKARGLREDMYEQLRVMTMSVADFLERWFESEALKATLATDGIIGMFGSPQTPGSAYVLLHHVMGETFGRQGVWAYVRGGMGGITQALANSFRQRGGEVRVNASVSQVLLRDGAAIGVALEDGTEITSDIVVSNADPQRTFLQMFHPEELDPKLIDEVKNIRFRSASFKINLALGGLPNWSACPNQGNEPGPQHMGTTHISPTMEYIERAFDDARLRKCSERPVIECTMASAVDDTLAPEGKHLMSMFVQYAPYDLDGVWSVERDRFARRCIDIVDEYAPGFSHLVEDVHMLSPVDLEQQFGLTGGNIFHGEMSLEQLFFMRPVPSCARYRTPVDRFYLCGAGTHPGGGVMGACGHNAAQMVLKDIARRRT